MNIEVNIENGIWTCDKDAHSFDEPLAKALVKLFKSVGADSVIDIGCGSGDYVRFLRANGIESIGIDGNPQTEKFCDDAIISDLSRDFVFRNHWHWALSLEVGEHIPILREQTFIDNVCRAAHFGIVLSWFPIEGHGIGHFNPRSNEYVKEQFMKRGFISDEMAQKELRESSSLWWFGQSLMAFRRI